MEEVTIDFSDFLIQEQLRQDEAARVAAEYSDQQRQEVLAQYEQHSTQRQKQELLAVILQRDAAKVATVALDRVPKDAFVGRFIPRFSGWIVSIELENRNDGGSGYRTDTWNEVKATILSAQGKLHTAGPVRVQHRDYPLTSRYALEQVLRSKSGLIHSSLVNEVTTVSGEPQFNKFRSALAKFVLSNQLQF